MANKISDKKAKQLRKEVMDSLDKLAEMECDLKREEVGLIKAK